MTQDPENAIGNPARLAALRRTALLDTPAEEPFDRLTRLASKALRVPMALISLVDEDRQFLKSCLGLPEPWASRRQLPLSHSFCLAVVISGQPFSVEDARQYPLTQNNPAIDAYGAVAYLGVPLVSSDGYTLGTFCVIDPQPRRWTEDEIDSLKTLAVAVMTEIELRLTSQEVDQLVSEARQSEAVRRASEERFQLVAWATRDAVWDWNLETDEIWWSEGVQRLFHYQAGEVAPQADWWFEHIHPEDRDKVTKSIKAVIEYGGQFWSKEYRYRRSDGTYADVFDRGYIMYDGRNKPKRMIGAMIDITERKRAEETLAHERDLLQALMDNVPDMIYFKDTASRFTRVNKAQAEFLGLGDPQAALGKTDFDFQAPELAKSFYAEEQEIVRTGKPLIDRLEFNPTAQGEDRWFSATKVPIFDQAGQVAGLVGVSRNITRLKKIEADLRTQRELFKDLLARQITLYEVLRTVSGQLDSEAVAQATLQAIARFAGWPDVAIVLPDHGQTLVIRAAAGRLASVVGLKLSLAKSVAGRAYTLVQTQFVPNVAADPSYVAGVETTRSELAVPLRRGERVLGVLDIQSDQLRVFDADDISLAESLADAVALALDNAGLYTAIANERSQLEALITANRDGVILVSVGRRVLIINEPALQLLGLPGQPGDWLDRPLRDALVILRNHAPAVVEATLSELRRIRRGDEPPGEGEYEVPPRAIHWFDLPVMAGPAPLGRLLVLHDVTEERLLAKVREDLTDTMVHDLRNPLSNIFTVLEILSRETETLLPEKRGLWEIALQNTNRMLGLVDAILEVSRLESREMPLEREKVSLAQLVAETLQLQTPLADKKNIRLENALPPALPAAWADPKLIGRVLHNLIGNAIKFTPAGGAIRIGSEALPVGDKTLRISVSDTGSGIPLETQPHLFQKFFTGRQKGRGSGLGLVFCKLAVEAHGGRIWVESDGLPGRGATFKFTLPLAE